MLLTQQSNTVIVAPMNYRTYVLPSCCILTTDCSLFRTLSIKFMSAVVGVNASTPCAHELFRYIAQFLYPAAGGRRLPATGPKIVSSVIEPSSLARDLGVFIDSDLSMETHVKRTVSSCFGTLRLLRSIRRQVPTAVFHHWWSRWSLVDSTTVTVC